VSAIRNRLRKTANSRQTFRILCICSIKIGEVSAGVPVYFALSAELFVLSWEIFVSPSWELFCAAFDPEDRRFDG
jgi:hypothetical protein